MLFAKGGTSSEVDRILFGTPTRWKGWNDPHREERLQPYPCHAWENKPVKLSLHHQIKTPSKLLYTSIKFYEYLSSHSRMQHHEHEHERQQKQQGGNRSSSSSSSTECKLTIVGGTIGAVDRLIRTGTHMYKLPSTLPSTKTKRMHLLNSYRDDPEIITSLQQLLQNHGLSKNKNFFRIEMME